MEEPIYPPLTSSPTACALLKGSPAYPQVMGEVLFSPYGRGTLVTARFLGLPAPGFLGLHIHENGNCSTGGDISFAGAGGHYDPMAFPIPGTPGISPPFSPYRTGSP